MTVVSVERGDLASVANRDAVALEVVDEVVRHRFAQVRAAVEECDERPAAGEPDGRLSRRVATADDGDARTGAALCFGCTRRVEDRQTFELGEPLDGEAAVLGARCEQDRAGGDLALVLEPDEVTAITGLERERPIWRGGSRVELARLRDRTARQLRAA